ncbi:disulfide bond formation protein B [Acidimangrovimonas sediminis]|uniref:disulfide bond formation protein B n=1 Tax=Acidimangrovimonas sediminis TaxID=2056283 RepID=UPI000C8002B6|nr:disulfide bond formation protein B [Acidimangrovimonas sediminis]
MTRDRLVLIAGLGSVAALLVALGFEYIGGLAPCELCMTQRWEHGAGIVVAVAALILPWRSVSWLGALAMLAGIVTGVYQWGTQMKWWEGLTECTATQNFGAMSSKDALNALMNAPIVRCDAIHPPFPILGLTMPAWNAVLCFVLMLIWIVAARRKPRPPLDFKA